MVKVVDGTKLIGQQEIEYKETEDSMKPVISKPFDSAPFKRLRVLDRQQLTADGEA